MMVVSTYQYIPHVMIRLAVRSDVPVVSPINDMGIRDSPLRFLI
jgi:hypothetical protein